LTELGATTFSPDIYHEEDPLSHLASTFLIARGEKKEEQQLSKDRLADLIGRAKLGDIEGLAVEAQLSNRDALRFARSVALLELMGDGDGKASFPRITSRQQTPTRRLLRTPDSRKLAKELLAIFAKEASSKFASNRFLFLLSPTLDESVLENRFNLFLRGRDVFDEFHGKGRLGEARKLLATMAFSSNEVKDVRKIASVGGLTKASAPSIESDVIGYFTSRRKMIEIAHALFADFSEIKSLVSFLLTWRGGRSEDPSASSNSDAHDKMKNAIMQVLNSLKEVDELGVTDAEGIISDAEIAINDELQRKKRSSGLDRERVKELIENQVAQISASLGMNQDEEDDLMKAVFEGLASSPSSSFEFDRRRIRGVLDGWRRRRVKELQSRLEKVESSLRHFIEETDSLLERLVLLDQVLATASLMQKYSLVIPNIVARKGTGISFEKALNFFLLQEKEQESKMAETNPAPATLRQGIFVQPVNYSIGMNAAASKVDEESTAADSISARNVVMLTGANSGGKTTLLTTLASIHILSLYGLPVPCESAVISPMPIYLFRRRMTKKIGSLEQALRSLIPVFASDGKKVEKKDRGNLVLIDEFEALTEPGAAGRIIATMMNKAALGNNLVLLVTHLARETLPHIKLPIRVDGIEARGFDPKTGELVVNRQPKFNHIGSSSPQHIVKKLSKQSSAKSSVKALYAEILEALGSDSNIPVQTPLSFPWMVSNSESV
jgi:hypothetical protein